jgi:hypothetical protein
MAGLRTLVTEAGVLAIGAVVGIAVATVSVTMLAQSRPTSATYITKGEVEKVIAVPTFLDHTIKVTDIGGENFSVGVVHRGATGASAGRGANGVDAGRAALPPPDCGQLMATPPSSGGAAGAIAHDSQTEGYPIISGGGTVITGGYIVNGRKSAPDSDITTTLNGPSCSGTAYGDDIVRRVLKTGDIVIIPAGVPHGWTDIGDHVDYLSFRPSGKTLTAGYVNPVIK